MQEKDEEEGETTVVTKDENVDAASVSAFALNASSVEYNFHFLFDILRNDEYNYCIALRNVQVHIKVLKSVGLIERVGAAKGAHGIVKKNKPRIYKREEGAIMREKEKYFLGYVNIANCITMFGLLLSLSSGFLALVGKLELSITLFIAAGICDLFDGVVARKIKRTDEEKRFGIQLDTVVDVISFGVIPAVIVFSAVGSAWYVLIICAFYVMCAVTRLAYFNTSADINAPVQYYHGLPVTYITLILPIVMIFDFEPASALSLLVTGTLFILNIKVPKPRRIWYVVFPVLAVVLSVLWWLL